MEVKIISNSEYEKICRINNKTINVNTCSGMAIQKFNLDRKIKINVALPIQRIKRIRLILRETFFIVL
jgi:hypothetical protein